MDSSALQNAEANSYPEAFHTLVNSEKEEPLKVVLYEADILKDCSFLLKYNVEAVTLIEVLEHIEKKDLVYLETNIFGVVSPRMVVVTTPNYEFNYFFDNVSPYWLET